jgi:hypothetical protein
MSIGKATSRPFWVKKIFDFRDRQGRSLSQPSDRTAALEGTSLSPLTEPSEVTAPLAPATAPPQPRIFAYSDGSLASSVHATRNSPSRISGSVGW